MIEQGWHTDPTGAFAWRWHDGAEWTEHVSDGPNVYTSPMPAPEPLFSAAEVRPAPTPAPVFTVQPVKTGIARASLLVIVVAVIGASGLIWYLHRSDGLSEDAQRLLMQNALDAANRTSDQDVCTSIAILGTQSFVDDAVSASSGKVEAWVAEDEIKKRCG
jgi:hypothetical protein